MKIKTLILASSIALIASASATVTLGLNAFGLVGESGQTGGLTWGVVVDSGGNGFQFGDYASFSVSSDTFLPTLTETTDDFLFLSTNPTLAAGLGGLGTEVAGVTDAPGRAFALIWFDSTLSAGETATAGNTYGFYTQAEYIMPAAGSSVVFTTTDNSAKPALTPVLIPEPSAALLGALGALGLLRRRRI